ncbi:MAG: C1 family peptidase [Bacteroidales bacterium]|jgi:bleomycin hydrolase|nr:C1 family peptidase [Bacteroidales bacterium]
MKLLRTLLILIFIHGSLSAQDRKRDNASSSSRDDGYVFTTITSLKATPVKDQARTGTCWCFATTSFIESELLRTGKGEFDLSEMFIVRHNYLNKLRDNYIRNGKGNLGEGSLAHDFIRVFTENGIVPEEVYTGLNYGSESHNHSELQSYLSTVAGVAVQKKKESDEYHEIVNGILDSYLGELPQTFTWKGESFTPSSFVSSLGINPEDYVEITSFSHIPYYSRGLLEVPDNWAHERFYNVPLEDLIHIMDYSFANGYTVNWDGDVSERGFSRQKGIAINPAIASAENPSGTDGNTRKSQTTDPFSFTRPVTEVQVTQDIRQAGYENFSTTDDHLMHLTGTAMDQNGTLYYITKNSWGTDDMVYNGYWYMSESYVRAKTIFIMVHKDGIPREIRDRLGI